MKVRVLIWFEKERLINRKAYFREASFREKQNILMPIKSTTVGPNYLSDQFTHTEETIKLLWKMSN